MATTTDVLQYTIHLTDPVLVAQLQAHKFYSDLVTIVGIGGVHDIPVGVLLQPPAKAAVAYAAPLLDPLGAPGVVLPFVSPSITSPWFVSSTAAQYPRNILAGSHHSGGFLGIGGNTHRWYWMGRFEYSPTFAASPITGEAPAAMPVRRFLDGAEIESAAFGVGGEGGTGGALGLAARGASRHLQGYGYKFNNTNSLRTHTPVENGHAATPSGWDRLYIRPNVYPAVAAAIWASSGATSGAAGAELGILPNGALTATSINSIGTRTLLATSAVMPLRTWKKIDILWTYNAATPVFQVYINNVLTFDIGAGILGVGGGLQQAQNCQSTSIGDAAGSGKLMSIDIDDWVSSDLPVQGSAPGIYPAYDWNYGSRIALVGARGFASDNNAAWAAGGDWRATRQHHIGNSGSVLASSTALSRLSITTDAGDEVDTIPSTKGIAAFLVSLCSFRGTTSGQLGYRFPPAAAVMAAITQGLALNTNNILYAPAGVINPTKLAGLELVHDKGNDASATNVRALLAVAEVIGVFGKEDVPAASIDATALPAPPAAIGIHNAPYPRTAWARGGGQAPTAPYAVYGGTYVGTGTFKDLAFNSPIHFLWIRPLAGGSGGVEWWSSMNGAHFAGGQSLEPDAPVEVLIDPTFAPGAPDAQQMQTIVRIVGNAADKNAAAVTYAYIAVSDPGERFLAAGAFKVLANTVDVVETLDISTFNPDAVFAQIEVQGTTGTVKMYFKGPGSGATNISGLTTAEIAGLSKAAGSLTIKAALANVSNAAQIAYLALRKDDGSADAGLPGVMWLTSYVGDGSASRTINFAPASGKRPQWALVVGHNGTTVQRDHQHTGTTSTTFPNTANAANGITGGGIDSLSVGANLNTGGVTFDVLVFPGDATAVNGGFSGPVTNVPVDPAAPAGGPGTPWDVSFEAPDVPTPVEDAVVVEPGGDTTDFGDQCVTASTKIINQALSHIGITKQIGDVTTEQSAEAQEARLHYSDDLSAVLRDFPWPFATRYARLVRVDGTAAANVNGDWIYSFRAPDNMMFARRIVNEANAVRRTYDPTPIDFRVGGDATGTLIYTNQQAVVDGASLEPELEYTVRPSCAASQGDALFRQALAWRHAATLAMSLARDEKKAEWCLQVYGALIERAKLAAVREEQKDPPGDAEWLTGRN